MSREEFVRRMHSRLDKINSELDEMMATKDQMKASMKDEWAARAEALRGHRDQAVSQLTALEQSSEGAWHDMKAGVEMAWDALGQAVDSAKSHFKR